MKMEELLKIQNNDSEQLSHLGSEAESISLPYLDLHGNENLEASFFSCVIIWMSTRSDYCNYFEQPKHSTFKESQFFKGNVR